MKSQEDRAQAEEMGSPPARGAWIEILRSLSARNVGTMSPPARGAWIEISCCLRGCMRGSVAPRTGGVD